MTWDYIKSSPALLALCEKLQGQKCFAIDTEFMRERTYYAKLCLLQIASENTLACIDPLALDTIDPLLDLLYETDGTKIFHSARQDLELFYDLRGSIPVPVFDTQIAAALLGHPYQIGYADLVKSITGNVLEKGHTRANWASRPLKPAQLQYAVDDVHYLYEIYEHLRNSLAEHGRLSWLEEECNALTETSLYQNKPEEAYRRIKQTGNLTPVELARLKALAAWREQLAKDRNLPRFWIVRDPALIELAKINPADKESLQALKSLQPKTISHWGNAILETLKAVRPEDTVEQSVKKPLTRKQAAMCDDLVQFIRRYAEQNNINASILANRSDIKAFVVDSAHSPLMVGWRRKVIGDELLRRMHKAQALNALDEKG